MVTSLTAINNLLKQKSSFDACLLPFFVLKEKNSGGSPTELNQKFRNFARGSSTKHFLFIWSTQLSATPKNQSTFLKMSSLDPVATGSTGSG